MSPGLLGIARAYYMMMASNSLWWSKDMAFDVDRLRPPRMAVTLTDEFGWAAEPTSDGAFHARRLALPPGKGAGFVEQLKISDDLFLTLGECTYRSDEGACFIGDNLLKVHVQLEGSSTILLPDGSHAVICAGNWGMLLHPRAVEKVEWVERRQRNSSATVYCRPSVVAELLGRDIHIDDVQRFAEAQASRCTWISLSPDAGVQVAVREMLHCSYVQPLRTRFLEAKATELVCRAIGAISDGGLISVSNQTEQRLEESREILLQSWDNPPTIDQLARMVGINRRALISGFKARFGTTIFDFVVKQRMAHACVLLQDREISISEVAYRVGYSQPNSFAAAFRREFNCTPSEARHTSLPCALGQ